MKIQIIKRKVFIFLNWEDINFLKEGKSICERYNGEHKINIGVIPETLVEENWIDTRGVIDNASFNEYLHDFFFNLSIFTVRCAFVKALNLSLNPVVKNPYFRKAKIFFPV